MKLSNLLVAGISAVVSLVAVEAVVRVWNDISLTRTSNFLIEMLDQKFNTGVSVHDPTVGWGLAENYYFEGGGMTTGAFGIRMNENAIRPLPQPRTSVLAVGDSFTVGSGVTDSESWPARLEQFTGIPVVNGAAGGWGVDQMVLRAEQLVPAVRPHTLIVSVLAQDSLRNSYSFYGGGYKPYFTIEDGDLNLHGQPVPRLTAEPIELGPVRAVFGHSYLVHWGLIRAGKLFWWSNHETNYRRSATDQEGVQISCLLMDRVAGMRDAHDLDVIVMMQWGAAESMADEPPWYGPPVLDCARKHGFGTLETYNELHRIGVEDQDRFRTLWIDEGGVLGHMSVEGNRLMAELLAREFFPNSIP